MPTVSVIIPSYNSALFIRQALDSALAQQSVDVEVIVVDASTDATPDIVTSYGTPVRLMNPMSRESEVLRPNLVAGLLRACAHNLRQGSAAVRLFEIGRGFHWAGSGPNPGELPVETPMIAAIVAGARYAHSHRDAGATPKDSSLGNVEFEDAKGLWEAWLEEMSVDTPNWRFYAAAGWKPGASAEVARSASRISGRSAIS